MTTLQWPATLRVLDLFTECSDDGCDTRVP